MSPLTPYGIDVALVEQTVARYFISGNLDPTVTPTLGISGTMYIYNVDGDTRWYKKDDDGLTTNWSLIATAASITELFAGFEFKDPCRLKTIGPDTLSGFGLRDGVAPVDGNRILVNGQADPKENGIYIARVGAWERAADFDNSAPVKACSIVAVEEGDTLHDTAWILTTNNPIVIGTSLIVFAPFGVVPPAPAVVTVTSAMSPYQMTGLETIIQADTSAGPVVITTTAVGVNVGVRKTIKKIDPTVTPNDVTIGPSLDGAPVVLSSIVGALLPSIDFYSDGVAHRVI